MSPAAKPEGRNVPPFVLPTGVLLTAVLLLSLAHQNLWRILPPGAHRATAWVIGPALLFLWYLGPLIAYPWAWARGAGLAGRAAASLAPFLGWWLVEVFIAGQVYGPGRALYYLVGPMFSIVVTANVLAMSVAEILCRLAARRRGTPVSVLTPAPVVVFLVSLAGLLVMFAWGEGAHWFYVYQEGYKLLFL